MSRLKETNTENTQIQDFIWHTAEKSLICFLFLGYLKSYELIRILLSRKKQLNCRFTLNLFKNGAVKENPSCLWQSENCRNDYGLFHGLMRLTNDIYHGMALVLIGALWKLPKQKQKVNICSPSVCTYFPITSSQYNSH